MSERPICKYCGQGPFPDLKKWALHPCYTKPQIAEVIAQLRVELKAAQDKLAEIEARNCENCQRNAHCIRRIDWVDDSSVWLTKKLLTSCSEYKRKEPTP